jgi:4-alpha-glucanotransferase
MHVCKRFEEKYNMHSDVFMDKWGSGKLDDSDDYFDWFAAKKGFDIWARRLRILAGVNIR